MKGELTMQSKMRRKSEEVCSYCCGAAQSVWYCVCTFLQSSKALEQQLQGMQGGGKLVDKGRNAKSQALQNEIDR